MAGSDRLSPREAKLVAALASSPSIVAAARSVPMSERTARRWLAERPAVAEAWRTVLRGSASDTLDRLRVGARLAVEYLTGVIVDEQALPTERRRAAGILVGAYSRITPEVLDHEDRLVGLEQRTALHAVPS